MRQHACLSEERVYSVRPRTGRAVQWVAGWQRRRDRSEAKGPYSLSSESPKLHSLSSPANRVICYLYLFLSGHISSKTNSVTCNCFVMLLFSLLYKPWSIYLLWLLNRMHSWLMWDVISNTLGATNKVSIILISLNMNNSKCQMFTFIDVIVLFLLVWSSTMTKSKSLFCLPAPKKESNGPEGWERAPKPAGKSHFIRT